MSLPSFQVQDPSPGGEGQRGVHGSLMVTVQGPAGGLQGAFECQGHSRPPGNVLGRLW